MLYIQTMWASTGCSQTHVANESLRLLSLQQCLDPSCLTVPAARTPMAAPLVGFYPTTRGWITSYSQVLYTSTTIHKLEGLLSYVYSHLLITLIRGRPLGQQIWMGYKAKGFGARRPLILLKGLKV